MTNLVISFSKAGDDQSVEVLEDLTHPDFRIIWHDAKNPEAINISRESYLDKILKKEFGGDRRRVEVKDIRIFGEGNASVQVILTGEKSKMFSFLSLANIDGEWKVIQEFVTAEFF